MVFVELLSRSTVVRFRRLQVLDEDDDTEETAIAAFWVSDGIDSCRVGYLPRHCLKHWKQYEGRLAQVIDLYKDSESPTKRRRHHRNLGCCLAVMIDAIPPPLPLPRSPRPKKRARVEEVNDGNEVNEQKEEKTGENE
jgi:hypothetical protein